MEEVKDKKVVLRRKRERVLVRLFCVGCGAHKERIKADRVGEHEYWRFWKSEKPLVNHGRHNWKKEDEKSET